jgi:hypothetical protein
MVISWTVEAPPSGPIQQRLVEGWQDGTAAAGRPGQRCGRSAPARPARPGAAYRKRERLCGEEQPTIIDSVQEESESAVPGNKPGREQIAVVGPVNHLLAMTILNYADQVKKPKSFEEEVTHPQVSAEERRLAETLIEASTTGEFDLGRYKDEDTAKLTKLIEAKAKGRKIVAARRHEEPAVINLMDALRQSLDEARTRPRVNGQRRRGAARKASSRGHKGSHPSRRRKTG